MQRIKKEAKSIPRIEQLSGTGFFVSPNIIVTNKHVVERAEKIDIVINDKTKRVVEAEILMVGADLDIAILSISKKESLSVNLSYYFSKRNLNIGDDIFVLGFPSPSLLGSDIKLTDGIVNSTNGFLGDTSLYQISAPIQPGNSGSPLLDKKGNVRGIVVSSYVNGQLVNYAIKSSQLYQLLTKFNADPSNKESTILLPKSISTSDFKSSISSELPKVCQIICKRRKHYFEELDIYKPVQPQNITFTECDEDALYNFCDKVTSKGLPDSFENALVDAYYFRRTVNSSKRFVGIIYYGALYNVDAYENLIQIVNSEYPLKKILNSEMNLFSFEVYINAVLPLYWRSYTELYSEWNQIELKKIDSYVTSLFYFLKEDPTRYHLLPEVYLAKANILVSIGANSFRRKLKQIIDGFDEEIALNHIDISQKQLLDDFRPLCN